MNNRLRTPGYYWVKFTGDKEYTIGYYEPFGNGIENIYPWQVVGSDEIYDEGEFEDILPNRINEPINN